MLDWIVTTLGILVAAAAAAFLVVIVVLLVVSGCGPERASGLVVARDDGTVTIGYCYVRAKLSDYVRWDTYATSRPASVGAWWVQGDHDRLVRSERKGWCDR